MTALEQILVGTIFVLLCTVAAMWRNGRFLGRLLDQARADQVADQARRFAEDCQRNAAKLAQLADQAHADTTTTERNAPMTVTINPRELGFDGRCDSDDGCGAEAVAVMLSASRPSCWPDTTPAASIAFLCAEHLASEPLALREHAEENAELIEGPCRRIWAALLAVYPTPLSIAP